jgi:hypothetical protein
MFNDNEWYKEEENAIKSLLDSALKTNTPKIGYKGFDKNLKCKDDFQFEIGKEYSKELPSGVPLPRLCSSDGFHYCNNLKDVFSHYRNNGQNRFCEIEILGSFTDSGDKSVSTKIKILREISKEEINEINIENNLKINEIVKIQKLNPLAVVGGSVALFLQGVRLKRWFEKSNSDFDIIVPHYTHFNKGEKDVVSYLNNKKSSNDFDYTFIWNNIKVDVRIDAKQRYEIINYKGFDFKVCPLEIIIEAKARYAIQGNYKHQNDLKEMVSFKPVNRSNEFNEDIFEIDF